MSDGCTFDEICWKVGNDGFGDLFAVDLDFCGDDPYEAAFKLAKELSLDVHLFEEDFESPNGFPVFRFRGHKMMVERLLEVYGI